MININNYTVLHTLLNRRNYLQKPRLKIWLGKEHWRWKTITCHAIIQMRTLARTCTVYTNKKVKPGNAKIHAFELWKFLSSDFSADHGGTKKIIHKYRSTLCGRWITTSNYVNSFSWLPCDLRLWFSVRARIWNGKWMQTNNNTRGCLSVHNTNKFE